MKTEEYLRRISLARKAQTESIATSGLDILAEAGLSSPNASATTATLEKETTQPEINACEMKHFTNALEKAMVEINGTPEITDENQVEISTEEYVPEEACVYHPAIEQETKLTIESEVPAEPNTDNEIELILEPELTSNTELTFETELIQETEITPDSEPIIETELILQTEITNIDEQTFQPEFTEKVEFTFDTELNQESEQALETVSPAETEIILEPENVMAPVEDPLYYPVTDIIQTAELEYSPETEVEPLVQQDQIQIAETDSEITIEPITEEPVSAPWPAEDILVATTTEPEEDLSLLFPDTTLDDEPQIDLHPAASNPLPHDEEIFAETITEVLDTIDQTYVPEPEPIEPAESMTDLESGLKMKCAIDLDTMTRYWSERKQLGTINFTPIIDELGYVLSDQEILFYENHQLKSGFVALIREILESLDHNINDEAPAYQLNSPELDKLNQLVQQYQLY